MHRREVVLQRGAGRQASSGEGLLSPQTLSGRRERRGGAKSASLNVQTGEDVGALSASCRSHCERKIENALKV